jgi:hypothetical protein
MLPSLTLVSVLMLAGCPAPVIPGELVSISELGFDALDHARDLNDYPWAMAHFVPGGSAAGRLYVGTGNSVMNLIMSRIGVAVSADPVYRAPEIRRYVPGRGEKAWERVLDYRDIETEPAWQTSGFRSMGVYQPAGDAPHLYAGTIGKQIALWRSRSGDAGTWERVWLKDEPGSIRSLVVHNDLLYIAITHEFEVPPQPPGEVWATDGATVWPVITDGFGNPRNTAVFELASFNGWLYAGTLNREQGYEIWKLAGPDDGAGPVQIVSGGGPSRSNMGVGPMLAFKGQLYAGALVFMGLDQERGSLPAQRGADMIRIDPDDRWETVVGPNSVAGVASGFGDRTNAYLWSLAEHEGLLYCGTWDADAVLPVLGSYLGDILRSEKLTLYKPVPNLYDRFTGRGAELWVSADGAHWEVVFTHGLGNPDHYGVRNLVSVAGELFIGLANIVDGLEIWKMPPAMR